MQITAAECHWLGLYLTNTCNRSCSFCFKKHGHPRPLQISKEDLEIFCDWANRNDVDEVTVAGGEPTTHPDFVSHIRMIQTRIFLSTPLKIITNLLCDEEKLEPLVGTLLLVNTDSLDQYSPPDLERLRKNLKAVASQHNWITLSYTIWRLDQPEDHLLSHCEEFGIKAVRLDLSRASILKRNRHVTLSTLGPFKEKLLALAGKLVDRGVKLTFDCPLPHDMFTEQELHRIKIGAYYRMDPYSHMCEHLYANPDLTISACPHQLLLERRLDTFSSYPELHNTVMGIKKRKLMEEGIDQTGPCLCEAERFLK